MSSALSRRTREKTVQPSSQSFPRFFKEQGRLSGPMSPLRALEPQQTRHVRLTQPLGNASVTTCYLEQVAGVKFIGNQLERWKKQSRKPAHMPSDAWNQRLLELQGYLDTGMLPTAISTSNAQDKKENFFFSMPRDHQAKYAEVHPTLEDVPQK
eukprot:scaffold143105_cov21-Cyclotella_meneghiniana.AAC.1